jgi:hypothetical protein
MRHIATSTRITVTFTCSLTICSVTEQRQEQAGIDWHEEEFVPDAESAADAFWQDLESDGWATVTTSGQVVRQLCPTHNPFHIMVTP